MTKTYFEANPVEVTAEFAHEINRIWCLLNNDMSQPEWDDAPEWQVKSAINGVKFHLANPNAGDSASHDSWMKEKVESGWVYGEVKDPDATPPTHPCIVPFGELPKFQQVKDTLFRSVVHAVLIPEAEHSVTTVTDAGFNPSGDPMITAIKTKANELAQLIGNLPASRRRSVALTNLETTSMWAVKAVACGDD